MALYLQSRVSDRLPLLRGRRVMVVDAGSHSVKLLLARRAFRGLRVLWKECVDLKQEGLLSPADLTHHLRRRLKELDYDQIALVLPQHLSISQIIDLPIKQGSSFDEEIEAEIVKLGGLSESAIVYDYSRIRPFGKLANPFWVTLCRESEIIRQFDELAATPGDVCEVTPAASALIAAAREHARLPARSVLVSLGAENTVVVILLDGQGVFSGTFPIGGNAFTRAIATDKRATFDEAEEMKRSLNLFAEPEQSPQLRSVVDDWCAQTAKTLQEWMDDQRDGQAAHGAFEVLLCGGGAAQRGLPGHLRDRAGLKVSRWNSTDAGVGDPLSSQFVVAFGAALQVFGQGRQRASLLPSSFRKANRRLQSVSRLQALGVLLMLIAGALLAFGISQKVELVNQKNRLLSQSHTALTQAKNAEGLLAELAKDYEALRPVFERQKTTSDTLEALAYLQSARNNQEFWYLLFADQRSYFTEENGMLAAHSPAPATNRVSGTELRSRTNSPPAAYGFIAELCIPAKGSNGAPTLGQIVTNLRSAPLFGNVDALHADLRRNLVDPKLILPNRHFALKIELVENQFRAAATIPAQSILPNREVPRSAPRTFKERANLSD